MLLWQVLLHDAIEAVREAEMDWHCRYSMLELAVVVVEILLQQLLVLDALPCGILLWVVEESSSRSLVMVSLILQVMYRYFQTILHIQDSRSLYYYGKVLVVVECVIMLVDASEVGFHNTYTWIQLAAGNCADLCMHSGRGVPCVLYIDLDTLE